MTTTGAGPGGASGIVSGATLYQRVQRNGDPTLVADSTVSEGIGYGMVIAVYMDNQPLFNNLWNYEQLHLDANGLMNWYIDPNGATDANGNGAATDADEDMAWALTMAHYQWGDSTVYNGTTYNYSSLANAQITKIYNTEVEAGTYVPKPGDGFGGSTQTNPSYFDPAEYKVFAQFSGNNAWLSVAGEAYTVLFNSLNAASGNQSNGLDPAWCSAAGAVVAGQPANYQYDACRTPFRIFKDWAFFGDARSLSYTSMSNAFFVPIGAAGIVDGYALNGTPQPQYDVAGVTEQAASFVGPATCAAMPHSADSVFVQDGYNLLKGAAFDSQNHDNCVMLVGGQYYDQSWTVLSLLMMSGNYLDYAPQPSPTATPTPVPTADACQTWIRVNCAGPTYTSAATGLTWSADQPYTAGSFGYVSWAAGTVGTSTGTLSGTADPTLYHTERYGTQVGYTFTVPNGPATVTFYWAETYFSSAGQRLFNVSINGIQVESNLDLYQASGGENVAYVVSFPVNVSTGLINIAMNASTNNATIQAIAVGFGPQCTRTVTPTSTPDYSPTSSPTVSRSATSTLTQSPSDTPSCTPTPSASDTLSSTTTSSPIPSANETLSSTVTTTATRTSTAPNTATCTVTSAATLSSTLSATSTPGIVVTYTWTPGPSLTWSTSPSPTVPVSPSMIGTETPTVNASGTPSPTFSGSASPSASGSPSPAQSPSASGTQTPIPTALFSRTLSASVTPNASPTDSPVPSVSFSQTLSATATPNASATESPTALASSSETVTLSDTVGATYTGTPSSTGTATITSTVSSTETLTPTQSVPSASASATATSSWTATVSVVPTDTSTPSLTSMPTRTLSPSASGTPTATQTFPLVTPSPVYSATGQAVASGHALIESAALMPSPYTGGPAPILFVNLSAPAVALEWRLYTRAFTQMAAGLAAAAPEGWSQTRLSGFGGVNGLYFLAVRARAADGTLSPAKLVKLWVSR